MTKFGSEEAAVGMEEVTVEGEGDVQPVLRHQTQLHIGSLSIVEQAPHPQLLHPLLKHRLAVRDRLRRRADSGVDVGRVGRGGVEVGLAGHHVEEGGAGAGAVGERRGHGVEEAGVEGGVEGGDGVVGVLERRVHVGVGGQVFEALGASLHRMSCHGLVALVPIKMGGEGGNGDELREGCRDFNDGDRNWVEMGKGEGGGRQGAGGEGIEHRCIPWNHWIRRGSKRGVLALGVREGQPKLEFPA